MTTHRFTSHLDLARLPYFDLAPGERLVLADPAFGPSVDCHTHFALAYALPMRVDLNKLHGRTEHYLPVERPLDLDIYMNKNFTPSDLKRMTGDLTWRSVTASGMRRTHTAANLSAEMSGLGIAHSAVLPIELPFISKNAEAYLKATRGRREFICFGSVHPYELGIDKRLQRQKSLGAKGVKIHPAVQMIYPDDPRAMRVYALCGELDLPVLWHCGPVDIEPKAGRRRSQVRRYEKPVAENPGTTFLLGHAGALQPEVALELASRYPNVWLELASQALPVIRTILERGPTDRVVMGSDWPFYHQATGLAKALLATEGDETVRRKVLYGNAARLFGLPAGGSIKEPSREETPSCSA
ncbi:MAG: amidohydrolase family protein [Polyangia bacterium]|jgi:predicted TIM-barrel fold metal-dependent hydrolase|nr:amidohydrolase family protein [Polyangia bacterium]